MSETMNYSAYSDEKIIKMIKEGNEDIMDFLLNKYKGIVKRKARTMFLVGGDTDDLIQEGMIGLYKAIRDFNEKKEASFFTFANMCIDRQIYTAINASNRKKHRPLNTYVSFSNIQDCDEFSGNGYTEGRTDKVSNPEELYIDKENVMYIQKALEESLSVFEYKVLQMYMDGTGYQEIAEKMDKKPKAIDNALQRIKLKANKIVMVMEG